MFPPAIKSGDKAGIVSPSGPVRDNEREQFSRGVRYLEELGLKVQCGRHLFSGTPREKAEDINSMFKDPSVKAIISSRGGDTANSCLEYLDWNIIKNKPKIFMGRSDITVLLNAIYAKTGLITFHGNDIIHGLGKEPVKYDKKEFTERLILGKTGIVNNPFEKKTVRKGRAEGKLIGGNLRCFLKLAGTPYFPDMTGSVIFLESLDITPEKCEYMFWQLKHMGVFEEIRGVIIGHIYGLQVKNPHLIQMEEMLLNITEEYDFPILKVNNFGHNCPNTVLPVGAEIRLDGMEGNIEIIGQCVS